MDSLALGVLVAWAVRSPLAEQFQLRFAARWRLWLGSSIALVGGLDILQLPLGSPVFVLYGYFIIACTSAIVVLVVAKVRPIGLNRLLESRPLAHLGRHAYFIYLWHGILGQWLILKFGGPNFTLNTLRGLALVSSAVGVTWGASVVSWRCFEGPIVRWGQRHAY
jgi:peptidoglycan/LPS O-acetylase OafA/YrhL